MEGLAAKKVWGYHAVRPVRGRLRPRSCWSGAPDNPEATLRRVAERESRAKKLHQGGEQGLVDVVVEEGFLFKRSSSKLARSEKSLFFGTVIPAQAVANKEWNRSARAVSSSIRIRMLASSVRAAASSRSSTRCFARRKSVVASASASSSDRFERAA